jgi:hypothetical protein
VKKLEAEYAELESTLPESYDVDFKRPKQRKQTEKPKKPKKGKKK